MKANQKDMTTGSPLRHIITFAIPLFFGMLFQQFYSIADTMIVSRTIGEEALAAVEPIIYAQTVRLKYREFLFG